MGKVTKGTDEAMRRAQEATNKMIAKQRENQAEVQISDKQAAIIAELDSLNKDLRSCLEFMERAKRYKHDYNLQIETASRTGDKAKLDYYLNKRDVIKKQTDAREQRSQDILESIDKLKQ